MNGEMDVFEALGAPAYEPTYLTPSGLGYIPDIGLPAAPEPWLTSAVQPWKQFGQDLWEGGGKTIEYGYEQLPRLLWEKYVSPELRPKQRVVREGAGVTVVHSQPPYAGGKPASPLQRIFPFYTPTAGAPPQAVGTGTMILIGAGLLVLYILSR